MSERQAPQPENGQAALAAGSGSDAAIDISIDDAEPETLKPVLAKEPEPAPSSSVDRPAQDSEPSSPRAGDTTVKLVDRRAGETTAKLAEHRVGETTAKRTRAKVTLKIPDDEISRPQATPPAPPVKAEPPPPEAPPMKPMRIISIEPPAVALRPSPPAPIAPRPSAAPPPAPKPYSSPDDSWTPYEPAVAERAVSGVEHADRVARLPDGPSVSASVSAPLPRVVPSIPPTAQAPLAPPRPSYHSAPPVPAAAVVPPAPPTSPTLQSPQTPPAIVPPALPTSPMPLAPPTEPRKADSMDDIPIVTDDVAEEEPPPSSGEIEIDEDARPTKPAVSRTSEPKLVPLPPVAAAPSPPVAPAALRVEVASAQLAVTPVGPAFALPAPPGPPVSPAPPLVATPQAPVAAPASTAGPSPAVDRTALRIEPPSAPIAPTPPRVAAEPASPQPEISIKDLPPMRALAPTEPEGLEVHFEDEEPPDSGSRPSEPEAEIAPEDLVSVESVPSLSKPLPTAVPPPTETPVRAFTPVALASPVVVSAAASPPARGSLPPPPSVAAKSSVAQKPPPRVIVPTASALAPPPMSESAPGRRKARPWWEELFNDDFIRTMGKISDEQIAKEVDFVEESLAVAKGAMLLDLACGTGRHAIELTRRGYKVVGFDLSLPMLAKAAEEAQERSQKLNFVQGDMREMTFEDTFDGIYCWNTSFGFFEEDKNIQVIQRVHKALKKGGQFMLEVGNRDFIIRQAPSLAWFEGDGCICMDEMSIDWITSRMKVKRTMMMDDGRTKEIDYTVRIYSLHELGKILHDAGFRVAEVSGRTGTPGVYFGSESPRTMILAEKK